MAVLRTGFPGRALGALLLVATALAALAQPAPAPTAGAATVLPIHGAIGPATARFVSQGIRAAAAANARLVILEIDTPGGLDSSMRDIVQAILASPVPVVGYVSPSGARAASAGTYILYACHVAAMAPATNLGAATPVPVSGEAGPSPPVPGAPPGAVKGTAPADATTPPAQNTALERKVVNDAAAYITSLAELRGRNVAWAESAVRGGVSLSATAALDAHVIDLIAPDLPQLLTRLDGREVRLASGTVKLATAGLALTRAEPDWRTQLLAVITNPTLAYGLLMIGIWGLIFEGYNPGLVLPGVVGAICLLIALFAFQVLSVNYAGLALLALGVGLIIAEFFHPAYGSLGVGGLIAFVVGSLILFDSDVPGLRVGRPLIAAFATVGAVVVAGIVYFATRAVRARVVTGTRGMVGESAEVIAALPGGYRVRYGGELWQAVSSAPLHAGQRARIVRVEGLTLWVEPR